ncbi:MAG: TA system VapC family ribonuclease toxin [Fimbriimonas sp.]
MQIPDINLLVYAYDRDSTFHEPACRWLESLFEDSADIGIPLVVALGFVRIVTSKILRRPQPVSEALLIVEEWFQFPNVHLLEPGDRHWRELHGLLRESSSTPKMITDAHIAAIAIEHRATLCSNDRDFQRFASLRLVNPLEA